MAAGLATLRGQPVITQQPTNEVVISGRPAGLQVGASGFGWLTYQWFFNGTNLQPLAVTTFAGGGTGGDGGTAMGASLSAPEGVFVDGAGNVFIAEGGGNRVRKVGTNGLITTIAGTGATNYSGNGGWATNAGLILPSDVVVDSAGNVFIADTANNVIRKVDKTGVITTWAETGVADYSGDSGPATNAMINAPTGLALDNAGNLLVADAGNQRVRLIGPTGVISTLAGNGAATNASLSDPTGVAVDMAGNVYIADFGNSRIRQVATNGDIATVAGNGNYYTSGDEGSATNASLNSPLRVAVDGLGNLFIGDEYEGRIRKVDTNGIITTLVNGLNHPAGMAVDAAENLYIADAANNRIAEVALLGAPDLDLNPVTTNNAGSYEVVVSDANGSVTSSVVNLTVEVPANIATPPAGEQIVVGNEAGFAVSAGGTPPLSYQWQFDGTNLDGATNSTLSFLAATTNLTGGYAAVVTNNFGSVTSTVAGLTVLFTPPSIPWQTASQVAPSGSNATFAVVGSGTVPLSYQWYFNGVVLAGQTNSSLTLTAVTTNQAGIYSAVVSSPYGVAVSRNASLTVPCVPIITAQPVGQTVLAGGSVVLSVGVSGLGPLSFQWQCNGTNLPENLISTLAGNGTPELAGLGGPATAAGIPGPVALAVDGLGNLFLADGGNTIYQVDTNGIEQYEN